VDNVHEGREGWLFDERKREVAIHEQVCDGHVNPELTGRLRKEWRILINGWLLHQEDSLLLQEPAFSLLVNSLCVVLRVLGRGAHVHRVF
jgi:hypothetical protein